MNQYITGAVIKELREKKNLTQTQLASRLNVSDKTVSKWETGKGYPDITLLEPIAEALQVSVTELITGNAIYNLNVSSNVLKSLFYVCPVCGNIISSMGESVICCHGIQLVPLQTESPDDNHQITVERSEDEYYVRSEHEMSRTHCISFISAVSTNSIHTVKLYPEGPCECRFKIDGVKSIYYYCNKDGLFRKNLY